MSAQTERLLKRLNAESHRMDDIGHLPPPVRRVIDGVSHALRSGHGAEQIHRWLAERTDRIGRPRLASLRAAVHLHPAHRDLGLADAELDEMERQLAREADAAQRSLGEEALWRLRGGVAFIRDWPDVALRHYQQACHVRRSASNICNVFAARIRLGHRAELERGIAQLRHAADHRLLGQVITRVRQDPDLAGARASLERRSRRAHDLRR